MTRRILEKEGIGVFIVKMGPDYQKMAKKTKKID